MNRYKNKGDKIYLNFIATDEKGISNLLIYLLYLLIKDRYFLKNSSELSTYINMTLANASNIGNDGKTFWGRRPEWVSTSGDGEMYLDVNKDNKIEDILQYYEEKAKISIQELVLLQKKRPRNPQKNLQQFPQKHHDMLVGKINTL